MAWNGLKHILNRFVQVCPGLSKIPSTKKHWDLAKIQQKIEKFSNSFFWLKMAWNGL